MRTSSPNRFVHGRLMTAAALAACLSSNASRAEAPNIRAAIDAGDCQAAGAAINAAMDRNDPEAYYFAGYLYDATGCVKDDPVKAARFYRRAADLGNTDAATSLALLYGLGRGVDRDYAEAYRWYRVGTGAAGASVTADARSAAATGYALTVVRLARAKAVFPRQLEKAGVGGTLDAVFNASTGTVDCRNVKASAAIGSNVPRWHLFSDAVSDAYAEAVKELPRPDGATAADTFMTAWRFEMLRTSDGGPSTQSAVTVGATTAAP